MFLTSDIGGTKTQLALFSPKDLHRPHDLKSYPSQSYKSLETILSEYLKGSSARIESACFGVAGPVFNNRCVATNLPWIVDGARIARKFRIKSVRLLNDLEAMAWGIGALTPKDVYVLQKGSAGAKGNRAVIAAGTGLGEAVLFWNGKQHIPYACEGGHCDFAVRSDLEISLLRFLTHRFTEHVSCERVISGPGLKTIYDFLRLSGHYGSEPDWLAAQMRKEDPSAVIGRSAIAKASPLCVKTLDLFVRLYGAEAGNLVLKSMATGGIYIGGGIAPKILAKLKDGVFIREFLTKGRFKDLLKKIPVKVILNDKAPLMGVARFAGVAE